MVGNVCYKLLYRVGVNVNYETARSLYAYCGMSMAKIPTEQVYRAVYSYMRRSFWFIVTCREVFISIFSFLWQSVFFEPSILEVIVRTCFSCLS